MQDGAMRAFRRSLPPALHQRDFTLLWLSLMSSGAAAQMAQVAVGWQVYSIHRSAFDLGLVGLAEFLPVPLLTLPAGAAADRFPRARVFAVSLAAQAAVIAGLLAVTIADAHALWPYLVLAAATGAAGAFGAPAARAMPPELVAVEILPSAMALRSVAFQVAAVGGPAIGGLLFAIDPEAAYGAAVGLTALAVVWMLALRSPRSVSSEIATSTGVEGLLLGIRFVRATPIILGAITLDLFAVLFGGAVALLPLYARSILHTGPLGLGILRSAPAIGALAAGILLARKPIKGRAGRTLLIAVGTFGVAMVVFGLSRWFLLSLVALAVSGYVDMYSMNIRSTTVALAAPNLLRGRVTAVENVFIGASNELGGFESGVAAAVLGATPAVVIGGVVTIGLALVWGRLFPDLAHVDRLEDVRPARDYAPPDAAVA
jgi:MFS family permease